jgi:hypothetical protein
MAQTKIKPELIDGGVGIDWQSAIQTSNFVAAAGKGYFVDTTSGSITITLPAGVVGAQISIQDYAGTFNTNNVILNANGSEKIQGETVAGQITTKNATTTLVYQDSVKGWTAQNVTPQTFDISYLVVAGGGGGGYAYGGGGGAGGYKTNYGGTSFSGVEATNYTVTVGGGGTAATQSGQQYSGTNSTFATITSTGGGGGGTDGSIAGANGGSGGGGTYTSGAGGSGTSGQGNDGGSGSPNVASGDASAGGGGGAGAAGANAVDKSAGGNGGAGLSNSITGSAVDYAGGGGGGCGLNSSGNPGSGGTGGGASGGKSSTGGNGTDNTGGGAGGGGGYQYYNGGTGGSGVVILRYPTSKTLNIPSGSGLITSHLNTAISGTSDKYTRFTGGTGTISFS